MVLLALAMTPEEIVLKPGMVISRSAIVRKNQALRAPDGIVVHGDNLTIDFKGAKIRSGVDTLKHREDQKGVGILIEGCKNVTIKNATVQGYWFNIMVKNSESIKLENCDVSFSRAIRMMKDGRQIDQFLDLRNSDTWREYGAGIWLIRSSRCQVVKCRGSGGTIGCALIDVGGCTVTDSDFSFCGGWGIGMARSDENTISWNHLDFNNRVWGGGWGADAAGMGVADDCDENFFVGNSMTHGGDGFFLSNRNDVGPVVNGVFTPEGGSDHNVIAFNDGSWSPANAFEGTFSDGNVYYRNIANHSNYGFWLGFSNNSLLIENLISKNSTDGIAIEHGKGTKIDSNEFMGNDGAAIHLWASPAPERKPFPSTAIDILGNRIDPLERAYRLEGSTDVSISLTKQPNGHVPAYVSSLRASVSGKALFEKMPEFAKLKEMLKTRPKDFNMWRDRKDLPKGLEWVQPDAYGPRDFRGAPYTLRRIDPATIEVFMFANLRPQPIPDVTAVNEGPDGVYRVIGLGVLGMDRPVSISFVYANKLAGAPFLPTALSTTVEVVLRTINWNRKWFSWAGLTYDDREKVFACTPIKTEATRSLDGDWTGKPAYEGGPRDHFSFEATTKFQFEKGLYAFDSVSDDGFRLLIDGKPVIDRWNHHGPTPDHAEVELSGMHELRVEYCQEGGAAVLRLDWHRMPNG